MGLLHIKIREKYLGAHDYIHFHTALYYHKNSVKESNDDKENARMLLSQ